jgi:hypothetical protein
LPLTQIGTRIAHWRDAFVAVLERWPWLGWAGWLGMCFAALIGVNPRRYAATFGVYIDYARTFFAGEAIYDVSRIDAYLYWPVSLVVLGPFLAFDTVIAAALALGLSAAFLTWAAYQIMRAMLPDKSLHDVVSLTGYFLLINAPAAWFNFKQVQAQVFMTAGMMFAAAAMMRGRYTAASLWLTASAIVKPLSMVMILLCGALQPRMRLVLGMGLIASIAVPFAIADPHYLVDQYRAWVLKLFTLTAAQAGSWPYQADVVTLLHSFGIVLPSGGATAIRLAAALGTLALAWRITATRDQILVPLAILILSGCYCTLFGPRNEFLSFLILTPGLTALGLLLLLRRRDDVRGWLLVLAALVLGCSISFSIDRALKPAVVAIVYAWLIWLTVKPQRWLGLIGVQSDRSVRGNPHYDAAVSEQDAGNGWRGFAVLREDSSANRRCAD